MGLKKYNANDAPVEIVALAKQVMPLLLDGEHPAHAVLREQYRCAEIADVEVSGAGFFINFEVPPDAPQVEPADFTGGSAEIVLAGARHGAGCVLFVRGGRLLMLEGFTYDDEWPEHAEVVAVDNVIPIDPTGAGRSDESRTLPANSSVTRPITVEKMDEGIRQYMRRKRRRP